MIWEYPYFWKHPSIIDILHSRKISVVGEFLNSFQEKPPTALSSRNIRCQLYCMLLVKFLFNNSFSTNMHSGYIPWHHMGVSKNNGTPKSSILIGFSLVNHPFWGFSPYFWKHPYTMAAHGIDPSFKPF